MYSQWHHKLRKGLCCVVTNSGHKGVAIVMESAQIGYPESVKKMFLGKLNNVIFSFFPCF